MKVFETTTFRTNFVLPFLICLHKIKWEIDKYFYSFVTLYNYFTFLAMDYVPGGELFALWKKHGAFSENLVKVYVAELALVLGNH